MSTKQNQTKSKLSEVAKDLKISNQELSDFISDKFGTVKKPSASITQDELNYILESFSQNNQVDSFNPYFESRNNKPEPKKEEKPVKKEEKKENPVADTPKDEAAPKETAVDRKTVRAFLADKSRSGKTSEVKNLIEQFGFQKLSDVPDEKLPELYEKAQVL